MTVSILVLLLGFFTAFSKRSETKKTTAVLSETVPTPTVRKLIDRYEPPQIATASSYTVIVVGDSMVEALGPNFDELRRILSGYYPERVFGLFNYGFGATNILSLPERLQQKTSYLGQEFPAIFGREFDVIIIESFGHNPLSNLPLFEGLAKQTETLDNAVADIVALKPKSLIVFLATIAPSVTHYGKGVVNLTQEQRDQWVAERRFYIENHINYAKRHNIPLINVYEKTLDKNGQAVLKYINKSDYIHPSAEGIRLISQEIADFFKNGVLY